MKNLILRLLVYLYCFGSYLLLATPSYAQDVTGFEIQEYGVCVAEEIALPCAKAVKDGKNYVFIFTPDGELILILEKTADGFKIYWQEGEAI